MEFRTLYSNLTNPILLFLVFGIVAMLFKSDLEIPASSGKLISLYFLFSIGFNGGQEPAHSRFKSKIICSLIFGLALASLVPFYTFFILVGVILMMQFDKERMGSEKVNLKSVIHYSFTNGSVLMVTGSLIVCIIADTRQAEGVKPFTTDIFKGFLSIFLLEMGTMTAKKIFSICKIQIVRNHSRSHHSCHQWLCVTNQSIPHTTLETVLSSPYLRQAYPTSMHPPP